MKGSTEGWTMVLLSSLACILGAAVVFLDTFLNKKILENKSFLSASMSIGGGVLIFNSLYTLLPASLSKLNSNLYIYVCFFTGVSLTVLLTYVIQWCTPHAIHTCDPLSAKNQLTVYAEESNLDNNDSHPKHLTKPLLHHVHHSNHHHHHHHKPTNEYISYNTINKVQHHHHHHHSNNNNNNNNLLELKDDYFLIGIQTAIAICIHKFPEGLIMFVSNESSTQLGLSVAAAMTIHNFIEGFLIALPLYYATGSRLSAFLYASILGGLSQPLGAVLGLLAISNVDPEKEQILFGITFGIVSGMMCLIAIQSMLPQAIKADPSHRYVPLFFFLGILLVSITSLLQS